MDKSIAISLLPLVNNRELMDLLQIYAESRIARRHKDMEDCHMHDLKGHQDAIKELKRFETLRAEVIEKAKNG